MYLNREDIKKIQDVLDKFQNVETFELKQTRHSGIGSVTTITFQYEMNNVQGTFDVEISGVENW